MADLGKVGDEAPVPDAIAKEEERAIIADSKNKTAISKFRNICHITLMVIFTLLIITIIIVRVAQLLIPAKDIWLSEEQIKNINEFFVDGSIGAVVVGFVRSSVMDNKKP